MRDWATCRKKVAGTLTQGVGRSCALIHGKAFFPQVYCIKIQIYDEVRKEAGKSVPWAGSVDWFSAATIWPNICNRSTFMFDMPYVFLPSTNN